jgi:hypothetical protein
MVTKLKRDPLAPLLCLLESVQDNESYFWDTTLGDLDKCQVRCYWEITLPMANRVFCSAKKRNSCVVKKYHA